MGNPTKLKHIAEVLNVSIATVSRALNDKADISQKTKKRVLEIAHQLDYRPNGFSYALRKRQTTNIIGVILPVVSHFFFSSVLEGIMQEAHLKNHLVLVGESKQEKKKEDKIIVDFLKSGISGLLIAPANESQYDAILPVIHRRIPTVVIDCVYENYIGNYVMYDDLNGAILAVQHLVDQGYKNIAHIASDDHRSVSSERMLGYKKALEKNGIDFNPDYLKNIKVNETMLSVENGYQACAELFCLSNPPDAIFTVNDDVALGVIKYAREHNIKIPTDLGVIGFSDSILSKHVNPKLSTVQQNGKLMGETSFDFYYQAIQSNGQIFQKTFEPELVIRESSLRNIKQ